MRLKNCDKDEIHRAFVQFCVRGVKTVIKARITEPFLSFVPNTHKLCILRHCINIVFILQKTRINPFTFIF